MYAEELVVGWACRKVNRPVKWNSDRTEAFLADAHGRDHVATAEMAMDENGKFLAMRVMTRANLGAYLSTFGTMVPSYLYAFLLSIMTCYRRSLILPLLPKQISNKFMK